jgi:hypothetical protein
LIVASARSLGFDFPTAAFTSQQVDNAHFNLPAHSLIYADNAFTLYTQEDLMREVVDLELQLFRKSYSTRPVPPWTAYLQARGRKIVENAGNQINLLLPKFIHAVPAAGFELKVMLFVLAYLRHCVCRLRLGATWVI